MKIIKLTQLFAFLLVANECVAAVDQACLDRVCGSIPNDYGRYQCYTYTTVCNIPHEPEEPEPFVDEQCVDLLCGNIGSSALEQACITEANDVCELTNTDIPSNTKLTLSLHVPEKDIDPTRVFSMDELLPKVDATSVRGLANNGIFDSLDLNGSIFSHFYIPIDEYRREFPARSLITEYFIDEIKKSKVDLEKDFEEELLSVKDMRTVHSVTLIQGPMLVTVGIRDRAVIFELSNLGVEADATLELHGLEKALCGSSVRIKVKGDVAGAGTYDLISGYASLDNIKVTKKISVSCSSIIGKILDPIAEIAADFIADGKISDNIDEYLKKEKYIGGFGDLMNDEIENASEVLGIDVIEKAWDELYKGTGGFTLEYAIGVDALGDNKHYWGMSAYQEPVELNLYSEFFVRSQTTFVEFQCPAWATEMKLYKSVAVQTGTKPSGRTALPIYGVRFSPVVVSGTYYGGQFHFAGPGTNLRVPQVWMASCKSRNGLYSRYRAALYVPLI